MESLQERYAPQNACFGCGPGALLDCHSNWAATCRGTFVAVQEGRPAFHRW